MIGNKIPRTKGRINQRMKSIPDNLLSRNRLLLFLFYLYAVNH